MILDQSWQLSKNLNFRPKFAQIWPSAWVKSTSENKRSIQEARLLKSIVGSPRFFAAFALGWMHRSHKGPTFGAPLFGVSSPFGDAGSRIQDLEGRASPHLAQVRYPGCPAGKLGAGGKPSPWLPPGAVQQSRSAVRDDSIAHDIT